MQGLIKFSPFPLAAVDCNKLGDKIGWVVKWSKCCPKRQEPEILVLFSITHFAGQTTWTFWGSVSSSIKRWCWMRWALSKSAFNFPAKGVGRQKSLQTLPSGYDTYSTLFFTLVGHHRHGTVCNYIIILHNVFTISLILPDHPGYYIHIKACMILVLQFQRARLLRN